MSVIDEIKSKIDIVELIGASVKLQRTGRTYKGLSPFKSERSPSFIVYPETGTFKDYSSGEQGDVFGWLMKKEGLSFKEALRELAARTGVTIEEKSEDQVRNEDLETRVRTALADASLYFHTLLLNSPQARECLAYVREKRSLSEATLVGWQIGYSLNDYQALSVFLTGKGHRVEDLISAGLVIENEEGRRYDRFRNRLMIPIHDDRGRVIGFGSRSLDGSEPKYMNSPQTAVFDKGRTLFGLDRAKAPIRNGGNGLQGSVIVEGYMDVIGVSQAGFANTVSSMGTALTESQFQMLKRLHPRIVLALDPDAAGQRAILRGLDVARETLDRTDSLAFDPRGAIRSEGRLNADIRVAMMPDGKDPDELVLDAPDKWRELIANARPVVEHVIDAILAAHDLTDPKGKSQAVHAVSPIIKDLSDPVQRDSYVQLLSRRLQLAPRAVSQAMGLAADTLRRNVSRAPAAPAQTTQPQPDGVAYTSTFGVRGSNLELHFVALLAHRPVLFQEANVALTRAKLLTVSETDFTNPGLCAGFTQLSRVAIGGEIRNDEDSEDWLSLIADHPILIEDEPRLREEAVRTALRLRETYLAREQEGVTWRIQQSREAGDDVALRRYNLEAQSIAVNRFRAQKALRLRSALDVD